MHVCLCVSVVAIVTSATGTNTPGCRSVLTLLLCTTVCRSVLTLSLCPTDHTQENVLGSEHEAVVDDIITKSYLDDSFQSKWQPIKKQFIQNKTLEQRFEGTGSHCVLHIVCFTLNESQCVLHIVCFTLYESQCVSH